MDDNPYRAPDLANDPAASQPVEILPLASLGQRFAAWLIDFLTIAGPLVVIVYWNLIPPLTNLMASEDALSESISNVVAFLIFLAVHGYLVHTRDQTIGKLALGIKVTKLNGESPSTLTQLGLRYGFFYLIDALPQAGAFISFVSVLFIFGRQRRCLHDQLAGTRVVQCRLKDQ